MRIPRAGSPPHGFRRLVKIIQNQGTLGSPNRAQVDIGPRLNDTYFMGTIFHSPLLMGAIWAILTVAGPLEAAEKAAAGPTPRSSELRADVARLLIELDSTCFQARQHAAESMERLLANPEYGDLLARQFHEQAIRPEVSFEVRWHIEQWRKRLPTATADPPKTVSAEEVDRLARQFDDDSFGVRIGAGTRLEWLASNPRLAGIVMSRLKVRLADPELSEEAYRRLDGVRNIAWGAWLGGDAVALQVPPASNGQIDRWLEEAAEAETPGDRAVNRLRRLARQELLDALSQDSELSRMRAAIERHIGLTQKKEAKDRLNELLDLTRLSMVAECWMNHQQMTEQHLVIGVPTLSAGALRPTHFDRINDQTAHCASGNSLSPGDYPVGVAFPHPKLIDGFFHLVNLPTPRRQIAYKYFVKTDSQVRLARLSRQTFDKYLADKHKLSEAEVNLFAQLDARETSRFAGRYFTILDDSATDDELDGDVASSRGRITGSPSLFGAMCEFLATNGTQEAVPGLLEAIHQKRFLPPTPLDLYKLHWIAALSIARRNPWPGASDWLAEVSDSKEALIQEHEGGPELGATAAALLLRSHKETPQAFDLQPAVEANMATLGVEGYRTSSSQAAEKVRDWWKKKK